MPIHGRYYRRSDQSIFIFSFGVQVILCLICCGLEASFDCLVIAILYIVSVPVNSEKGSQICFILMWNFFYEFYRETAIYIPLHLSIRLWFLQLSFCATSHNNIALRNTAETWLNMHVYSI